VADEVTAPDDRPVLEVSEMNSRVRAVIEDETDLQDVWLRGEVSNYSGPHHNSGHLYFRLKDEDAEIDCTMWRRNVQKLEIEPEDGMEVLALGSPGMWEKAGKYQFYVERMLTAGRGDLFLRYQMLKEQLGEEGLFDEGTKRPLPEFPRVIGIVTSKGAAALQDVLNVLTRRSPHLRVLVSDARVQGDGAAETIVDAIERLSAYAARGNRLDLIVVTRGGGSMEDLWAFNEEPTVRAVANSRVPVVAGVGHETDVTLAGMAADARSPTPSAAAEVAAPAREEVLERIEDRERRLARRLHQILELKSSRLEALAERPVLSGPHALFSQAWQLTDDLATRLPRAMQARLDRARTRLETLAQRSVVAGPRTLVEDRRSRLDELASRLPRAIERDLERAKSRLAEQAGRLDAMSPLKVLSRGYSVATVDGSTVRTIDDVDRGDRMDVRVQDGTVHTDVTDTTEDQA
jgi:exodeoxyribonuclease VII large subunit